MNVSANAVTISMADRLYQSSLMVVSISTAIFGGSFIYASAQTRYQMLSVISKREYAHLADVSYASAVAGLMVLGVAAIFVGLAYDRRPTMAELKARLKAEAPFIASLVTAGGLMVVLLPYANQIVEAWARFLSTF